MANLVSDIHGVLVVSPQRVLAIDSAELVSGLAADNYTWLDGANFFHVKAAAQGSLRVVLIGDKREHQAGTNKSVVIPIHEGWNPDRIWMILSDAANVIDGILVAGR